MSTLSADEQMKFALACFRNSHPGKIDWKAVAKECNIVSPAAAQKRWERLNKANDLATSNSGAPGGNPDPSTPQQEKKGKGKTPKGSSTKKRKVKHVDEDEHDEEQMAMNERQLADEDEDGETSI